MNITEHLQGGLLSHSLVKVLQFIAAVDAKLPESESGIFVVPDLTEHEFYLVCMQVGCKGRTRLWHELKSLGLDNTPVSVDRALLLAAGLKIMAYFYRKHGKFYASGVVDIGDFNQFHDPLQLKDRVKERQQIMAKGWERDGEYQMVLHDTAINMQDRNYEYTVDRLYIA